MGQGAEDLEMEWARETSGEMTTRVKQNRRKWCDECGVNLADLPSKLCPSCESYRAHTGAI